MVRRRFRRDHIIAAVPRAAGRIAACATARLRHPLGFGVLLSVLMLPNAQARPDAPDTLCFLGNRNIAPVVYQENGHPAGVAVDIVRALSDHMSRPIEIRATDWSAAQSAVARGDADALIQINETAERLKIFEFSDALLESQFSIFTNADRVGISGLASLRGLRVGVESGGLPQQTLLENPQILLTVIPNFVDGFRQLDAGALDAIVVDYRVGSYILAENRIRNIKASGEPIAFSYSAIAVRKGETQLLAEINNALRAIKADGTYQAILDRWRPTEAVFRTQKQITRERYYITILVALVLVLIAMIWSVTMARELAKRKAAQETLRKQHSTLRGIIESTDALIFSIDCQYRYTSFNRGHAAAMKALYGVEIAVGARMPDCMSNDDDRAVALRNLERSMAGEHFVDEAYSGEAPLARRCYRIGHSPITSENGETVGVTVICQDITEKRAAEDALYEGQQVFRALVENSPDIIARYDRECRRTYVNPVYLEVSGLPQEQLIATSPRQLSPLPAAGAEALQALLRSVLDRGSAEAIDIQWRHIDGGEHWYNIYAYPEFDRYGCVVSVMTISRDITSRILAEAEKARLQDQLLQSQKMESIGRLAGGVAHDFNNMLSVILGYTSLALDQVETSSPMRTSLKEIGNAAERSAELTRQLLTFARKQTVSPRVLDLNRTVESMLKMLRRLIGEDIDLQWHPAADLWLVNIDPSQVDQILANLCVNARDAIADVGTLTIETANSFHNADYCAAHPDIAPGEYVKLSISDSGSGMGKEMLDHIFEPFFTSKGIGKGTGLGLATVYGAVRQSGGFINVYSELGHGTTFTIYLPRHDVAPAVHAERDTATVPAPRGHETILLVEDEPAILELTRTQLERQGYTVLCACTPGDAIRRAQEYTDDIHLLLTDVVMPEMNGRDLAKSLLALYPRLGRLFMSGYTADLIAHHGVLDDGVHFLQKPFTLEALATKVRGALDRE